MKIKPLKQTIIDLVFIIINKLENDYFNISILNNNNNNYYENNKKNVLLFS